MAALAVRLVYESTLSSGLLGSKFSTTKESSSSLTGKRLNVGVELPFFLNVPGFGKNSFSARSILKHDDALLIREKLFHDNWIELKYVALFGR